MIITIEIAPDLEQQLRQEAARAGLTPDAYIMQAVQERLTQTSHRHHSAPRLSRQRKRSYSRKLILDCRQPSGSGITHW